MKNSVLVLNLKQKLRELVLIFAVLFLDYDSRELLRKLMKCVLFGR